jgi:hypothetical protein
MTRAGVPGTPTHRANCATHHDDPRPWPGLAKNCTDYVRHCEHCQRFKHLTRKQGKHTTVDEPTIFGDTYHVDLIDSLPVAGQRNSLDD